MNSLRDAMDALHDMLRDMLEDWVGRSILLVLAVGIPALVYFAQKEAEEWAAFAEAHECRVTGHMNSTTGSGLGMMPNGLVGIVITTTPAQTGYTCNDGVTYWR